MEYYINQEALDNEIDFSIDKENQSFDLEENSSRKNTFSNNQISRKSYNIYTKERSVLTPVIKESNPSLNESWDLNLGSNTLNEITNVSNDPFNILENAQPTFCQPDIEVIDNVEFFLESTIKSSESVSTCQLVDIKPSEKFISMKQVNEIKQIYKRKCHQFIESDMQLNKLTNENQELHLKITELEENLLNNDSGDCNQIQEKLQEMELQNREKDMKINSLEEKYHRLNNNIVSTSAKLIEFQLINDHYYDTIKELSNDLESSKKEYYCLLDNLSMSHEKLKKSDKVITSLQQNNSILLKNFNELQRKSVELNKLNNIAHNSENKIKSNIIKVLNQFQDVDKVDEDILVLLNTRMNKVGELKDYLQKITESN